MAYTRKDSPGLQDHGFYLTKRDAGAGNGFEGADEGVPIHQGPVDAIAVYVAFSTAMAGNRFVLIYDTPANGSLLPADLNELNPDITSPIITIAGSVFIYEPPLVQGHPGLCGLGYDPYVSGRGNEICNEREALCRLAELKSIDERLWVMGHPFDRGMVIAISSSSTSYVPIVTNEARITVRKRMGRMR